MGISAGGSADTATKGLNGAFQFWTVNARGGAIRQLPTESSSVADPAIAPNGKWLGFVEPVENWNIWREAIQDGGLATPELFISRDALSQEFAATSLFEPVDRLFVPACGSAKRICLVQFG